MHRYKESVDEWHEEVRRIAQYAVRREDWNLRDEVAVQRSVEGYLRCYFEENGVVPPLEPGHLAACCEPLMSLGYNLIPLKLETRRQALRYYGNASKRSLRAR